VLVVTDPSIMRDCRCCAGTENPRKSKRIEGAANILRNVVRLVGVISILDESAVVTVTRGMVLRMAAYESDYASPNNGEGGNSCGPVWCRTTGAFRRRRSGGNRS